MGLNELNNYDNIVIQCHDNPDADSIASGYGIYKYFEKLGKKVSLIYSGRYIIQKKSLLLMIEKLNIPIQYVNDMDNIELLITVDCQYATGNVKVFTAKNVAVIDHHQVEKRLCYAVFWEVQSCYGSCATVVWQLLKQERFDIDMELSTALYYGLYSDTVQMTEVFHPFDKDMRDYLKFDKDIIALLKNSNISREELKIMGVALGEYSYIEKFRYAVIQTEPCDPNVLGLIGDFILQTDGIDTCIVFNQIFGGIKFSIRSCINEVRASDVATFIAFNMGSGGGHKEKAGGFICEEMISRDKDGLSFQEYFIKRMEEYFLSYQVIRVKEWKDRTLNELMQTLEFDKKEAIQIEKYKKKPIPLAYVRLDKVIEVGTPITIRTLEGDIDLSVEENKYTMIGVKGEVYSVSHERFKKSYIPTKEAFSKEYEYTPCLYNRANGKKIDIIEYAQSVMPRGKVNIWAKKLNKTTKVFTLLDENSYMLGFEGDYLAIKEDELYDMYIIRQNVFNKIYEKIEG